MDETVKCRICGKPYKFFVFYAGDQSACPDCRSAAKRGIERESSPDEDRRRKAHFGNLQQDTPK